MKSERLQLELERLRGWERSGDSITKTYEFPSFRASVAFVNLVCELAEQRDHHPDIDVRYSKVTLTLSTHSAGALTDKDFDLARLIDS